MTGQGMCRSGGRERGNRIDAPAGMAARGADGTDRLTQTFLRFEDRDGLDPGETMGKVFQNLFA